MTLYFINVLVYTVYNFYRELHLPAGDGGDFNNLEVTKDMEAIVMPV